MENAELQLTQGFYRFGTFRLERAERRLWHADKPLALTPKQFDLLFYFVENAGRVIKKSELLNAVWTDSFVEENTLTRNVSWLRKLLEVGGEPLIETVPKLGYRFTAEVIFFDEVVRPETNENKEIIVEKQIVRYSRSEEVIILDETNAADETESVNGKERVIADSSPFKDLRRPRSLSALNYLLLGITFVALIGSGFTLYGNYAGNKSRTAESSVSEREKDKNIADPGFKNQPEKIIEPTIDGDYQAVTNLTRSEKSPILIGSVIHLRNQTKTGVSYLDAWGTVKSKSEFSIVPTETMFVSTHPNSDRENGSGSWEIVSTIGKKNGEVLMFGDKIYLRNLQSDAGYLDNCGWIKDMPVFKDFRKSEKFAVFTAFSEQRDDGTGTWIVSSDIEFEGSPVLEEDGIILKNGFIGGGFLNAVGRVNDIPAFSDYDGSRLVFIRESTTGRHPNSAIWIISFSQYALK